MKFKLLSDYFVRLEGTSKRLEMFSILSELFFNAGAEDISEIIYLSQGQLKPPFYGIDMGMSEKLLIRALSNAADAPTGKVESLYKETGDLGAVAERLTGREGGLEVKEVYSELMGIAEASGKGSVDRKVQLLSNLLRGVLPLEARYVARFVLGRLRLGVGDPTVMEALAQSLGDRSLKSKIERAYNLCSDLGLVGATIKKHGIKGIEGLKIHVGYPVRMALCERVSSAEEIIQRIGKAAVEAKYDGFRCQVHKDHDKIEIFSRNLERMTPMFPEIINAVLRLPAKQVIFEGEALVHNEATGELMPFQITMQRKRKHGIKEMSEEFPLKFYAFDMLLMDGKDMTGMPYSERRRELEKLVKGGGQRGDRRGETITVSSMFVTDDPGEINKHFEEFVETGLEGIVAKRLDSTYSAGARNFNWIKLKRSYKGELADSVDLCIIGYYLGRGARAKFGIGALLGAVYEPETDSFKSITKIGTGFTEDALKSLKVTLDAVRLKHPHPRVNSGLTPDEWVEPRYVITVTADEITRSPTHTAGRDETGMGYALRFPRAVGLIRYDKSAEDSTNVSEIIRLAGHQRKVKL